MHGRKALGTGELSQALLHSENYSSTQRVKHLPYKPENPSSDSQNPQKSRHGSTHLQSQCSYGDVRSRDRRVPGSEWASSLAYYKKPHLKLQTTRNVISNRVQCEDQHLRLSPGLCIKGHGTCSLTFTSMHKDTHVYREEWGERGGEGLKTQKSSLDTSD